VLGEFERLQAVGQCFLVAGEQSARRAAIK